MTDSEKELRRLVQECIARGTPGPWPADLRALHVAMPPSAVLALLDRIEALETENLVSRRLGALEMQDRAATECETASIPLPMAAWRGTKKEHGAAVALALAKRIREFSP